MKKYTYVLLALVLWVLFQPQPAVAQSDNLTITTVTRPPFSMTQDGADTGFSIDLLSAIAADLDLEFSINRVDSFADMLGAVQNGTADGAIANISITAQREAAMDFSQPIFESGIQIMLTEESGRSPLIAALFTRDIAIAILAALGLLFGGGMLMWLMERKRQEYFDRPLNEAMFPSFWWALNLVVNGGFEERMPRSPGGRIFGVVLVFASLFIVSVFVAQITASMTLSAIQSNIQSINDIDGRRVGTIEGSTASAYLNAREIDHFTYTDLETLLTGFETESIDVVVFDAPILAYYVQTRGQGQARLLDRIFKPENYGMALPTGSPLREEINQSLLRLRENGTYDSLVTKWFGAGYVR